MAVISVSPGSSSKTMELVNRTSDWGISVSEANGQKTVGRKALAVAGFTAFAAVVTITTSSTFGTTLTLSFLGRMFILVITTCIRR